MMRDPPQSCSVSIQTDLLGELVIETKDRLTLLSQLETKFYRPSVDYLSSCAFPLPVLNGHRDAEKVTEVWRQKVCEWCYQVIDHFNFNREVVFIALNYLDRMVAALTQRSALVRKTDFRLIAVTSLYMAVKLHGVHSSIDGVRRKLRISSFYELSERHFSIMEIEAMERNMLSVFDWHVNPPTPTMYVDCLVALCPKWSCTCTESSISFECIRTSIKDLAIYLTELAVSDARLAFTVPPIMYTYAAILCASSSIKTSGRLPQDVKDTFFLRLAVATDIRGNDPDVLLVIRWLADIFPELLIAELDNCTEEASFPRNVSPVCVVDDNFGVRCSKRKQSR
jgi:Cyclin, N-terminal domain